MDFRDPIWTFWGVVFSILGIVIASGIAFAIYFLQKTRKSLTTYLITFSPLIPFEDPLTGSLKVMHGKSEVKNVHLVMIRFENNGNSTIKTSDFAEPITVNFGRKSKILAINIIDNNPPALKPKACIRMTEKPPVNANGEIEISPLLLNSKDSFILKVLVSDPQGPSPDIQCHIEGVKRLKMLNLFLEARVVRKYARIVAPITLLFVMLEGIAIFETLDLFIRIPPLSSPPPLLLITAIGWEILIILNLFLFLDSILSK